MFECLKKLYYKLVGICDNCRVKINNDVGDESKKTLTSEPIFENKNNYMACEVKENDVIVDQPIIEENMSDIRPDVKFNIPLEVPKVEYDVVIENLTNISKLEENVKLWLDGDKLTIDDSWAQPITRWRYGQSKDIIIPKINETIQSAFIYFDLIGNDKIIELLKISLNGLSKLTITYPTKNEEIKELILETRSKILKISTQSEQKY